MNEKISILVVDDDANIREMLCRELGFWGHSMVSVATGEDAVKAIKENYYEVVLLDIKLPGIDGVETLQAIKEYSPATEVIMLTGHSTINNAINSMKSGAYDYLTKPCGLDELLTILQKAYEKAQLIRRNTILEKELARRDGLEEIIVESRAFRETVDMAVKVASTDCTVLIQGESGVGKEVIAKLIHQNSPRKEKQFVIVDCSSLQETLLESELFGHEKGAFTGAYNLKHGLIEVAHSGTLFMDEIGELSLTLQSKLLRVIETGIFRRVGGTKDIKADIRTIVATNKDLMRMTKENEFRDDLFYRLNVICVSIPPLRNRRDDIPLLTKHFLNNVPGAGISGKEISPEAMELLLNYNWPGNIRELQNVIHSAVVLSENECILPYELPSNLHDEALLALISGSSKEALSPLEEMEKRCIKLLLKKLTGDRQEVAKMLKMSERTLYRKLSKYGMKDLKPTR